VTAHSPASRDGHSPATALFTVFSALWAAGTLFHIASYNQWGQSRPLVIAAALVLVWPRSVPALLALSTLQIYFAWHESPFIPNHYLFAALANVSVLAAVAIRAARRAPVFDGGGLVEIFGPPVRISLVLLYGFVVLHKLNADFFDPATSCGAMFYAEQRSRFSWLPDGPGMDLAAIVLAIGFEAAIGLLLLFQRTRHAGIVVGGLFHWFLAVTPGDRFYNFSALLLALFALFASPSLLARGLNRLGPSGWTAATRLTLALIGGAAIIGRFFPELTSGDRFMAFQWLWAVYGLVVLAAWVMLLRRARPTDAPGDFRLNAPVLALIPVVVVVNGFMPYLGLKTETSWAMFSNLRTEGGVSNHYLLPASLQVFDYQRQLVEVHDSSDRLLRLFASRKQLLPVFEIQRRQDVQVAFSQPGRGTVTGRAGDLVPGEIPLWKRKLLYFRPVDSGTRQGCYH
jgi:hypothetical protein